MSTSDEQDLSALREPTIPASSPEAAALIAREEADVDRGALIQQAEVNRLNIENEQRTQDRTERQKYAHRVFCLISCWLIGVFLLLVAQGWALRGFRLSDSIVITAVGSTTASVLGLFLIVANYLFPKRKD